MKNISIENIYWMMAYAFRDLRDQELEYMSGQKFENIYDLFAVMLTREINRQVKRGLNKEYIETSDDLTVIKGKIDLNETLKLKMKNSMKVNCVYDEYSANSYLNKIVKTAGVYLIKYKKIKDELRIKKLKQAILFLQDIDELEPKRIKWDLIRFNRYNDSYRMLVNLAHLLFDGLLVKKDNGKYEFRDYIDDQNLHKLYEKFILEFYRFHYNDEFSPNNDQIKWLVECDKSVFNLLPNMYSDITLRYQGRTLIIDAKYYSEMYQKNYDKEKFKSYNLYQIFTYVKNEDKEQSGKVSGMLLYAKTDKNDQQFAPYNMGVNKITVANLDLSTSYKETEKQLRNIADMFMNGKL